MIGRALLILIAAGTLAGCKDISMARQNRLGTYTSAALFPNNTEAQPIPAGTVAQGAAARAAAVANPPPVDDALLARGRERYDVYCSPCHGLSGHGDGMIVQRGFPSPPSYHTDRLRAAPGRYIFDVITNGYGVMYPYAARVEPRDRWAIVAYIRALQESQHAKVADLPEVRSKLP